MNGRSGYLYAEEIHVLALGVSSVCTVEVWKMGRRLRIG